MFGSDVLDVVVGVMFVYLLLAVICSALNEWIARAVALRASTLEDGIRNLLHDGLPGEPDFAKVFLAHPLIKGLAKDGKPSYIPARSFALALFDTVAPVDRAAGAPTLGAIRHAVGQLPKGRLQQALLVQIDDAQGDLDQARANVETWFNQAMDRVSGWYKRKVQLVLLLLALGLAFGLNVDTIAIGADLHRDATLRAAVIAASGRGVANQQTSDVTPLTQVLPLEKELTNLSLPFGWSAPNAVPTDPQGWLAKVVGLLFTAVAASLGAPFWFDLLNQITSLRASGPKPT